MKLTQDTRSIDRVFGQTSHSEVMRLRKQLLSHYDAEGRTLPWRIRPEDRSVGKRADPYAVWLSEIMLQQTTVPHATPYWEAFLSEFPTVIELANADRDRVLTLWAGLGYYARARNLHKCAQMIRDDYGGAFPKTEAQLLKLPGIGLYTAAAIAAICFDEPTNIVDGNVERVIARLFAVDLPLPKSRKLLRGLAGKLADPKRPGDYGQALMDLGSKICTPRAPKCEDCPWQWKCRAFKSGTMTAFPKKVKKTRRPIRCGAVFVLLRGGETDHSDLELLIARRPESGLLGGMMGFPGTPWVDASDYKPEDDLSSAPLNRNWEKLDGEIRHVFTHFDLRLRVYQARISSAENMTNIDTNIGGEFVPLKNSTDYALPTVMKKALDQALKRASK